MRLRRTPIPARRTCCRQARESGGGRASRILARVVEARRSVGKSRRAAGAFARPGNMLASSAESGIAVDRVGAVFPLRKRNLIPAVLTCALAGCAADSGIIDSLLVIPGAFESMDCPELIARYTSESAQVAKLTMLMEKSAND